MSFEARETAGIRGPGVIASSAVRILVIDDDEDDFLIVRDLLTDVETTAYVVEWARNPETALARLSESPACDVCLLDYRLGRHSGLELLRTILAEGHRIPIVLLTGQDDSDVDQEAMRAGASDYLVKGRINSVLLERSVRYALRHQRDADELRRQNAFVSAVVDTAGALVIVLDRQGRVTRFNRACEQVSGYTFAELQGKVVWDYLIPPAEMESVRAVFDNLLSAQFPNDLENDWITRQGELRRVSWSNTVLLDEKGKIEYVIGTGIDVTEKRRVEQALTQAREREVAYGAGIQRTLLLRKPIFEHPGLAFGVAFQTSQKVGGDFFDFFSYGERFFDVLIGDVMGKGVPAALLAAATKAHFQRAVRRLLFQSSPFGRLPEPEEIVAAVHGSLTPELFGLCSFVTLAYARFDLVNGQMTLVDCGHPRPLRAWRNHRNEVILDEMAGDNMPLGMNASEHYRQYNYPMAPGDVFVFYSDGVTDAPGADEEPFGDERLQQTVLELGDCPPQEMAERLCASVAKYSAGAPGGDDLTCLTVRIEEWKAPTRTGYRAREIFSDPTEMEAARGFIEDFCLVYTPMLVEDERERLVLAANEAIGNVMRHAYQGRLDRRIQIELEAFEDFLSLHLHDTGNAFVNRDSIPPPTFDGSRDNGFGFYLIQQCVDEVKHVQDDMGRNTLTLIKRYEKPEDRVEQRELGVSV